MSEDLLNYFGGDELASSVWKSKYAADGEKTPDDMHVRLAKEFYRIEQHYINQEIDKSELSEYGKLRSDLSFDKIYNLMKGFDFIVPQGSVMATLGTDIIASLSNCFVIPEPLDSYGSIMQTDQELVQLYKRRGGVGTGISNLRPNGYRYRGCERLLT
jgi:ribonucleoside-diphosphate reductase alpha chain